MEPIGGRPLTELELLKMKMNKTTDESLESTRRMVQLADESHKTGAATLEQLSAQGETLRKVDQDMDVIHRDVREAEENLEYLERCCGLCIPPWKKAKKIKPDRAYKPTGATSGTAAGYYKVPPQQQQQAHATQPTGPVQGQFIPRITNDAREDEMETNLQHVAGVVTDLRMMATDMNQEIRTHNEILERLDTKTTANQARIADAQARAERIVGKPASKEDNTPSTSGFGFQAAKLMMK